MKIANTILVESSSSELFTVNLLVLPQGSLKLHSDAFARMLYFGQLDAWHQPSPTPLPSLALWQSLRFKSAALISSVQYRLCWWSLAELLRIPHASARSPPGLTDHTRTTQLVWDKRAGKIHTRDLIKGHATPGKRRKFRARACI